MYGINRMPHRGLNVFDDRLFDGMFALRDSTHPGGFLPALDVVETTDGYEVTVDLPGVAKEDLEVNIADNILTINAQSGARNTNEGHTFLLSERHIGKQSRTLRIGKIVDQSRIHAAYQDGVLKLTLPRMAKAEAKNVKVEIEVH